MSIHVVVSGRGRGLVPSFCFFFVSFLSCLEGLEEKRGGGILTWLPVSKTEKRGGFRYTTYLVDANQARGRGRKGKRGGGTHHSRGSEGSADVA